MLVFHYKIIVRSAMIENREYFRIGVNFHILGKFDLESSGSENILSWKGPVRIMVNIYLLSAEREMVISGYLVLNVLDTLNDNF